MAADAPHRPEYAALAGRITLTHADTELDTALGGQKGPTAWWRDGTTSYVLHFRSGQVHGWTMADETDTAIRAVDSLRAGEEMDRGQVRAALRDIRRLRLRLEAVESELLLYAQEKTPDGHARLSLRDLGEVTETHHTTVGERVKRMTGGLHPAFRNWLVQGTPRTTLRESE